MTITINAAAQDLGGDAVVDTLPTGTFNIYGGTPPVDAKAAQGNDVIATGTTPAFGDHSGDDGASMSATATLTGTTEAGGGTAATHFRFLGSGATGVVIQGSVGGSGSEEDLELDNVNIADEQVVEITAFNFTLPDGGA